MLLAFMVLAPRCLSARLIFDSRPDKPVAFGYQMAWLAIRSIDTQRVLDSLCLDTLERTNWSNGIGTVYHRELGEGRVFVSPPVEGWTFVVGMALPQPLGPYYSDTLTPLLLDLGDQFPEVHYYLCDSITENYAWARVDQARLKRAFALGDDGINWNKGKVTSEELELGLAILSIPRTRRKSQAALSSARDYPTEAHVVYLAGRWGLDPTTLDNADRSVGAGFIGFAPAAWAPARLRRTG